METGVHVWCQDYEGDSAWLLAEIITKAEDSLLLCHISNPENRFSRKRISLEDDPTAIKYEGVELANAKLSEQERAEGADDDLITLPHLHEPALLHAIEERFLHGKIYTWTGPVLIAVNPFQRLPLYTREILESYRREGLLRSQNIQTGQDTALGPHVYSIADRSYRQMMMNGKSQSILISGESGAGKTESTKIVMLYLTTLGSSSQEGDEEKKEDISVMERVLQSNPILEAFGNARTLRNDNSSRFGKFIELGFSRSGMLLGAKVQTYLLEKVRLAWHASGERNYHIFYQLLRGATEEQKRKYGFHDAWTGGLELPNYFHYTGQGGAPQLREFTDESGLEYTLKAMRSMGWREEKIDDVLAMIAALLHLGQIQFNGVESASGEEVAELADESIVVTCAELLGVDLAKLKTAVTERVMLTRGEEIRIQLTPIKASEARDALAKTIYGAMFLWVVSEVNKCVGWTDDTEVKNSVGVLDIFGFECFATNSFEQLCINFTNEALQQQFNKFIFKMEQSEYESEQIDWEMINFPDNQDCLDTISSRPNGVLSMLDDECRLPRGSDKNWVGRLYKHFIPKGQVSENGRFSATSMQKVKALFCIRHFAGLVEYKAETGFLEKNKDEIPLTAKNLFETAPSQLLRDVYEKQRQEVEERAASIKAEPGKPAGNAPQAKPALARAGSARGSKQAKTKTVGQQFKDQLHNLMTVVESTEPHYIRCLKPNDAAKPKMSTRKRLTEQLRYGGVLEAVRVARMGYPVRLNHAGFFSRYRMLLPTVSEDVLEWSLEGCDPQTLCVKLVDMLLEEGRKEVEGKLEEDTKSRASQIRKKITKPPPMTFPKQDVQLGISKVFMRKPPHDAFESHRFFHQNVYATYIQAVIRGMQENRKHLIICAAALTAQRFYRGCKGRERWWILKEAEASQLLTNAFHMLIYRRKYLRAKKGTIRFQAIIRGRNLRRKLAIIVLQSHYRMYKRQTAYQKLQSATVALQCAQRRRIACKELKGLQGEQKDIGKLKENNEKLKLEMASLKAMLSAQAKGASASVENKEKLMEKQREIERLEKRVAELEKEIEEKKKLVEKLEREMQDTKESNDKKIKELEEKVKNAPVKVVPASHLPREHMTRAMRHTAANAGMMEASAHIAADALEGHLAEISRLEQELEKERRSHREADGEIIKLRAEINGVKLNDSDVDALLAPVTDGHVHGTPPVKTATSLQPLDEESEKDAETEEETQAQDVQKATKLSTPTAPGPEPSPAIAQAPPQAVQEQTEAPQAAMPTPTIAEIPAPSKDLNKEMEQESKKKEDEEYKQIKKEAVTPEVITALGKLGVKGAKAHPVFNEEKKEEKKKPFLARSPSDYFPMVRRGMIGPDKGNEKEEEEVMAVGWKVEITNRKEREMALCDEVRRLEIKMKRFYPNLEEGVDVIMWQLNRNNDAKEEVEFTLRASPIHVRLHRRGDLLLQAVLTFTSRGGYLSKAFGRGEKPAIEPLSLNDILEVSAGCAGFDHTKLPSSSSKNKDKKDTANKHISLFLTLKASPTPLAGARLYIMRFKSRSARNDLMNGLRGLLADLQIREGVSISSIHAPKMARQSSSPRQHTGRRMPGANSIAAHQQQQQSPKREPAPSAEDIMIPLADVHKAINKERQMYDRLLLMFLQGNEDLKRKEDDLLKLRGKLDTVSAESEEKDRTQANDSKLIMQLSKKLETLLMDNEDLRDQNDRLNTRLVQVECEKMNLMSV